MESAAGRFGAGRSRILSAGSFMLSMTMSMADAGGGS
jgi:hypothetical protein